jgi:hypothetical protein
MHPFVSFVSILIPSTIFHAPFCLICEYPHPPCDVTQMIRHGCILTFGGYPGYGQHSSRIVKSFACFFSKSLKVCSNHTPRTAKVLKATSLDGTDKHKEKNKQDATICRLCETSIHLGSYLHKSKKKKNDKNYHHCSIPTPTGGSWATDKGVYDINESDAWRAWVQRASTSSCVRSALRPDPSSSSLVPNSGKCDRAATNIDRVPQRTPLAVVASIWSSNSSIAEDSDAAKEDGSSALFNTNSQTRAA